MRSSCQQQGKDPHRILHCLINTGPEPVEVTYWPNRTLAGEADMLHGATIVLAPGQPWLTTVAWQLDHDHQARHVQR